MSSLLEKEKEVEISRIKHSIIEAELKVLKKEQEIETVKKSIDRYKKLLEEKGA